MQIRHRVERAGKDLIVATLPSLIYYVMFVCMHSEKNICLEAFCTYNKFINFSNIILLTSCGIDKSPYKNKLRERILIGRDSVYKFIALGLVLCTMKEKVLSIFNTTTETERRIRYVFNKEIKIKRTTVCT